MLMKITTLVVGLSYHIIKNCKIFSLENCISEIYVSYF